MMKRFLSERIQRMKALLDQRNIDAVVATSSANFFYFTETWINPHERLLAFVVPRNGDPVILAPEMHKEDLSNVSVETLFWEDGQDAISLLAKYLPNQGTISVDNLWPSQNLISLMTHKPGLKYVDSVDTLGAIRLKKDERERTLLREAGAMADRVMAQIVSKIMPGMTELEVIEELTALWRQMGVQEMAFPSIIGAGANGARPHHQSDETVIREDDMVVIDMGGISNHYCSDMTRTVAVGEVSEQAREVYEVVRCAQQAGADAVKAGIPIGEVDRVTRAVIEDAGYGQYFIHRTGHGLGIEVHEAPYVYGENRQIIEPGMVFSIEPGIYLPGKLGVRIEDIVFATETGCESFNQFTKDFLNVK